jgi:cytochrome b pre-mRNA-processing protein 3
VLTWLRSRSRVGETAAGFYGSIVAQARTPAFYAAGGVPDNMEGRFGLIGVHMFLVLERIRLEGEKGNEIGRALLEAFMTDMDDNMREIGIGDTVVPRRVKKAAAALREHLEAYRAAFAQVDDAQLTELLARYVYLEGGAGEPAHLAGYMRRAARRLGDQPWADVGSGKLSFPTYA